MGKAGTGGEQGQTRQVKVSADEKKVARRGRCRKVESHQKIRKKGKLAVFPGKLCGKRQPYTEMCFRRCNGVGHLLENKFFSGICPGGCVGGRKIILLFKLMESEFAGICEHCRSFYVLRNSPLRNGPGGGEGEEER